MKTNKINPQLISPKIKPKLKPNQKPQCSDSSRSRSNTPSHNKISKPNQREDKHNKTQSHKTSIHVDKSTVRIGQNIAASQQAKNGKVQNSNKTSKRDKEKIIKSKNSHEVVPPQKYISKQINQPKQKQKIKIPKEAQRKGMDKDKDKKKQKKSKKIGTGRETKKSYKYEEEEQINKKTSNHRPETGKLEIDLKKKNIDNQSSNKTTVRVGQSQTKLLKIKELPSYRQYCVIKGIFVPLQSTTERKCLDNMFCNTASTSPEMKYGGFSRKMKHFQHISNLGLEAKEGVQQQKKTQSIQASIGIETIKTELAHYEVLVKAAQQDIGIQYSDRLSLNSGRKSVEAVKIETIKPKMQLSTQSVNNEKPSRPGLLQVMMNIEALELDEAQALNQLGREQKRHFRQVFESLIVKMRSPRIEPPPNCPRQQESLPQISKLKYQPKQNGFCWEEKREEFEQLLMMRESRQVNQFNISIRSPEQVDTSVLAIIAGFADIFCYAQLNYEENLLQTMNSLYGLSYTDKYRCISKYCADFVKESYSGQIVISNRINMEILKRQSIVKALPDHLFVNFMKQLTETQHQYQEEEPQKNIPFKLLNKNTGNEGLMESKSYFWIHSKAIFDCINEMLTPYRPFYPTKGDPFPWTLSPLKCLTFYSIDSESLETVIEQLQQKITKFAKSLCGIHIDPTQYTAKDYQLKQQAKNQTKDVVFCIRREKLSRCMVEEEDTAEDPYLELEIQTTCVLHELSLLVSDLIMGELGEELMVLLRNQSKKALFL